jgi:tetratricopeptide (TPR) repeat protein
LIALCAPTFAEDEPAQPLVRVPDYGIADIAPSAGELPEGWAPVTTAGVVPASAPSVKAVLDLAADVSLDAQQIDARCIQLARGEGEPREAGVLLWVAIDAPPAPLRKALAARANEGGWRVRELGSPMRLGVSWGNTGAAARDIAAWQIEVAVTRLCHLVFDRIAAAPDRAAFERAVALLEGAGRIQPEAGVYRFLKGRILVLLRRPRDGIPHLLAALEEGVPAPPPGKWVVEAAFHAGQALLEQASAAEGERDELLARAQAVLEKGVAAEAQAASAFMRFGNRYNLACTHARLGRTDAAFLHLEESLRFLKTAAAQDSQIDYRSHFEHARSQDPDMEPLKADARFEKLMAKYDPEPSAAEPAPDGDEDK